VDDEPNILSSLRRLFRQHGYRVTVANSGAEGLIALDAEPFDLVISDMRMAEMDGARFLEQVRIRWPSVVRILLTGYAEIGTTIDAINKGEIHRYISKPWDDNDIVLIVQQALERQQLEREKTRLEALTAQQNEELKDLNANLEQKVIERTAELRKAHEKLKISFLTSIKIFANLTELREISLAGHSRRVADIARKIAQKMGLDTASIQTIFLAGLLHDIGKIGLPDHLLQKPVTQMTGAELGLYRKHPIKGEQSLMALEELREAAKLIRSHHEQFDGQGYPEGLSGLTIPPGARILAVANDYDALQIGTISNRRLSTDEARKMIANAAGKRYDPLVVQAFIETFAVPLGALANVTRQIGLSDIKPGMVLARDLLTRDGVLLLATDYVLNESMVHQIREYAAVEGVVDLDIHIKPGSIS
jgi:response regulator RpfG family c-di-GMP phosphodiesterase